MECISSFTFFTFPVRSQNFGTYSGNPFFWRFGNKKINHSETVHLPRPAAAPPIQAFCGRQEASEATAIWIVPCIVSELGGFGKWRTRDARVSVAWTRASLSCGLEKVRLQCAAITQAHALLYWAPPRTLRCRCVFFCLTFCIFFSALVTPYFLCLQ